MEEQATKCYLKTTEVLLDADDMNLPKFDIYQSTKQLQIVLRATQILDVLFFFKKKFCLMSGLKFTLSDTTSLLSDDLSRLKKNYIQTRQSHKFSENEQMQMVLTTEKFL